MEKVTIQPESKLNSATVVEQNVEPETISKERGPYGDIRDIRRVPHKQKGATLADFLLWAVIALIVLAILFSLYPKGVHMVNMIKLNMDVSEIKKGAKSWKQMRPNYDDLSMSDLCTGHYIGESICGESNDGTNSNPWGGDYTITVNSNTAYFDLGVTNIDENYGQQVIDSMASTTADNCSSAGDNGADCDTISLSSNTATLTVQ